MNGGYNHLQNEENYKSVCCAPVYEWRLQCTSGKTAVAFGVLYSVYERMLQCHIVYPDGEESLLCPVYEWRLQYMSGVLELLLCLLRPIFF